MLLAGGIMACSGIALALTAPNGLPGIVLFIIGMAFVGASLEKKQ